MPMGFQCYECEKMYFGPVPVKLYGLDFCSELCRRFALDELLYPSPMTHQEDQHFVTFTVEKTFSKDSVDYKRMGLDLCEVLYRKNRLPFHKYKRDEVLLTQFSWARGDSQSSVEMSLTFVPRPKRFWALTYDTGDFSLFQLTNEDFPE